MEGHLLCLSLNYNSMCMRLTLHCLSLNSNGHVIKYLFFPFYIIIVNVVWYAIIVLSVSQSHGTFKTRRSKHNI